MTVRPVVDRSRDELAELLVELEAAERDVAAAVLAHAAIVGPWDQLGAGDASYVRTWLRYWADRYAAGDAFVDPR